MKNEEFIQSEYPKCCRVCEKGKLSFDQSSVLCSKMGVMDPEDCCKKFVYDPLKRVPLQPKGIDLGFSAEEFSL